MKLKSYLFFLCACLPFLSCKQEQPAVDEAEPSLEVSVTDLELSAVAAEAAFEVTSNQDWSADADVDWITLNPPMSTDFLPSPPAAIFSLAMV